MICGKPMTCGEFIICGESKICRESMMESLSFVCYSLLPCNSPFRRFNAIPGNCLHLKHLKSPERKQIHLFLALRRKCTERKESFKIRNQTSPT